MIWGRRSGNAVGVQLMIGSSRNSVFRQDLLASVVVFLVALPLCMGVAIASGMPPTAGIITGIIGGLVVGGISGSPLQVSGPAAGLSVLVLQFVQANGAEMLGVVVLVAGLLQIAAGALKLGQWFRAVSPSVIHGMLAGIGVLILVAQFHVMLDGKPIGTGIQNLIAMPGALLAAVKAGGHQLRAGITGVITIASITGWAYAPRSLRLVPAPLVGVLVATLAAAVLGFSDIAYVHVPDNILATVSLPTFANLSRIVETPMLIAAVSIAFIASAETLLCATAVDQMHRGPRTKYDQELAAQGVGNTLCGLFCVLPMTGVIVRSSANIDAGGKTRMSAVMHGMWLLVFATLLPFTLSYIPIAALAAVLVYTGYKLAYPRIVPTLRAFGDSEVAIYAITIAVIVATNLLAGVVVGLALSLLKLLYVFSHLDVRSEHTGNRVDLFLKGAATVVRLPMLASELERLKPSTHVHVHIDELDYIDHACIDLLTNWDRQHRTTGGSLNIEWDGLTRRYWTRGGVRARAEATGL